MDFNPFQDSKEYIVKIKPQSKQNRIRSLNDVIVIETTSPAIDNKANNAVLKWLKKELGVNAQILKGEKSRLKRIKVTL